MPDSVLLATLLVMASVIAAKFAKRSLKPYAPEPACEALLWLVWIAGGSTACAAFNLGTHLFWLFTGIALACWLLSLVFVIHYRYGWSKQKKT